MVKVRKALFMFTDLFGVERYNYNTLVSFILTVRTNYRSVVYHNWAHGFHEYGTQYKDHFLDRVSCCPQQPTCPASPS